MGQQLAAKLAGEQARDRADQRLPLCHVLGGFDGGPMPFHPLQPRLRQARPLRRDALLDGARYVDDRLAEIIAELEPDAIVEDNVCAFPAIPASGRPWVRIMSCNPLELRDPGLPPPFSGLPIDDPSGWGRFIAEYAHRVGPRQRDFSGFCVQRGAPPLPAGEMIHESPWLNLALYPDELDYPRRRSRSD